MTMKIGPPKDNLFLIGSCINTSQGIFTPYQRYNQTISTIESVKEYCPDNKIILCESSEGLSDKALEDLNSRVDIFMYLGSDPNCKELASRGLKSTADSYLVMKMLESLKTTVQGQKIRYSANRIYKLSGRYVLTDKFEPHNSWGKYIFKRYKSWKNDGDIPYLYITRLFSFCPSLIDDLLNTMPSVINGSTSCVYDMEHLMFKYVNSKLVNLSETLGVKGYVAPNGTVVND